MKHVMHFLTWSATIALLFLSNSCSVRPHQVFSSTVVPIAPDYSQDIYWAALPWKKDSADLIPNGLTDRQSNADIDVFFLHPTTYTGKKGDKGWNGPVNNKNLNERTSESTIKFQASIFNGVGRIFAPYYRQAHLHSYSAKDTISARSAFELAYEDVRSAFRYYLDNHNQGRPFIIASHSQGTTHSIRLLQEFIDGKDLQKKMITAYIVGIPVFDDAFKYLQACKTPTQTGCYTAWRTFKNGYELKKKDVKEGVVVTNPLSWTIEETYVPKNKNKGAVIRPFEKIIPEATDAQIAGPILLVSKPKFSGSWLLMGKNYHIGDMNIFYINIRENAALRKGAYFENNK